MGQCVFLFPKSKIPYGKCASTLAGSNTTPCRQCCTIMLPRCTFRIVHRAGRAANRSDMCRAVCVNNMRTPGGEVAHAVGTCWADVWPLSPTPLLWFPGGGGVNVTCLAWCAGRPLQGNRAPRMCLMEDRLRIRKRFLCDSQLRWMSTDYSSPCSEGDPPVKRGTAQATCQETVSPWCVCTIWVRPPFSRPAMSNLRNRSRTACFGLLPKGKTPIAGSTGYR